METLTMAPFQFLIKPTHKPYPPPSTMSSTIATNPTHAVVSSASPPLSIHSSARSELLCRYPSKLCDNLRSEKRGGGLHRFCAVHRERANINQRRVDHRRRLRRRGGLVSPIERRDMDARDSSDEDEQAASQQEHDLVSLDEGAFGLDDDCQPLCVALSEDDLRVLIALLDEPSSCMDMDTKHTITPKDEPMAEPMAESA